MLDSSGWQQLTSDEEMVSAKLQDGVADANHQELLTTVICQGRVGCTSQAENMAVPFRC